MPGIPAADHAYRVARSFFADLARAGVREVGVCPGSRSTPLALAAAETRGMRVWTGVDERSAGFFALGLAKARGEPVALVCTSGTAAANLLPAVIEAHYARVPLIVLTADRPPELRDWGAAQTIDQLRLYGPYVRWFVDVPPVAPAAPPLRYARALASRAVAVARDDAGPVQLNFGFREPLEPGSGVPPAVHGRGSPYTRQLAGAARLAESTVREIARALRATHHGVVTCGPRDACDPLPATLARLGRTLGWPVFAETTAQLRRGPHVAEGPLVAHFDLLLRDARFASRAPRQVLHIGAPLTSKAFRLWLERWPPERLWLVDAHGAWPDASHLATDVLRTEPVAFCKALTAEIEAAGDEPATEVWRRAFLDADARLARRLRRRIADSPALLSPGVIATLGACLPRGATLFVSNSLPVRDLDAFLPLSARPLRVLANRGANGIDGIVSSALGASVGSEGPLVLLTGDLALLHDLGGLVTLRRHALPLTLVVLNNDGGGIFEHLPLATQARELPFEELFVMPHGLELRAAADLAGASYVRAASAAELRAAVEKSVTGSGACLIEVPLARETDTAARRRLWEEATRGAKSS